MAAAIMGKVDKYQAPNGRVDRFIAFVASNGKEVHVGLYAGLYRELWFVYYDVKFYGHRATGKRFRSVDKMLAHYKTIRAELAEAARLIMEA